MITRRTITREQWIAEGEALFGKDVRKWRFVCPRCKHVQSGESVIAHNPGLSRGEPSDAISDWIYFSCEGRHTPKYGCDWTLGGLFQIHTVEVIDPPRRPWRVFDFDRSTRTCKASET